MVVRALRGVRRRGSRGPASPPGTSRTARSRPRISSSTLARFRRSLLKELRAIDFVDRLLCEGKLSPDDYRQVRVHIIGNRNELNEMGPSSKMNAEWAFLTSLRDLGRATATAWLDETYELIGKRSSVDLRAMFQGIGVQHQG